jgi:YfiH family protein
VGVEEELVATEPELIAGVPAWRFATSGARALFLGRGAPERDAEWPRGLTPDVPPRGWLRQVHSNRVIAAHPGPCGEGDALVVESTGLAISVATADCVPILVATGSAAAAIHAGWRGLAAGVVAATLEKLGALGEAVAWIGPAIGPCCYEVGEEVASAVVAASAVAVRRPGPRSRPHVDLGLAASLQLRAAGVGRILRLAVCTRCRPAWLWSHRGDGAEAGRNLALIWREPSNG